MADTPSGGIELPWQGAQAALIQGLLAAPNHCFEQRPKIFDLAAALRGTPALGPPRGPAMELGVVIPFSFFERADPAFFNFVAMVNVDGRELGVCRKNHVPEGRGRKEKFYLFPGDPGLRVGDTAYGRIGVGI